MAPSKRLGKEPSPTPASAVTTHTLPKPSRNSWKTKEQGAFLLGKSTEFVDYQNEGTLERFWPPIYDTWYKRWPILPTPQDVKAYGSSLNAILTLRSKNNTVRIMNSYSRTRDHSSPLLENSYVVSQ